MRLIPMGQEPQKPFNLETQSFVHLVDTLQECSPEDYARIRATQKERVEFMGNKVLWTFDPPEDLGNWKQVLEDSDIDVHAQYRFFQLASSSQFGRREAERILAHLTKDRQEGWRKSPSAWLNGVVSEALEALSDPRDWEGVTQVYHRDYTFQSLPHWTRARRAHRR